MSSSHTSHELHCVHTDSTPRAASVTTAAEAFCTCMERHVLQNGINRIAAEEAAFRRIEQLAVRLYGEQDEKGATVQQKIERAAVLIRLARTACSQGRELADEVGGSEVISPPLSRGKGQDNRNEDECDRPIDKGQEDED